MAARTRSRGRRADVARSRAGRTLVALLGVSSIALTAAAAEPLGPRARTSPDTVFALGEDGLGTIDMLRMADDDDEAGPGDRDGVRGDASRGAGSPGSTRRTVGEAPGSLGLGLSGGPVEVPVLGEESFASVIPGGIGAAGIPAPTLRAYRAAAEVLGREAPGCGIDWALLAGIGRVEANHGRFGGATVSDQGVSVPRILGPRLDGSLAGTQVIRDTDGGTLDGDAAYDRAVGPMQFLPGTWARWGSDGDRDGTANPQDIDDAALAAARYLCEGRSGLSDPDEAAVAVRRYNNSSSYVQLVLSTAEGYRSGVGTGVGTGRPAGLGTSGNDGRPGFGDGSDWSPFSGEAPPPGWSLPPGTVVGAGPLTPGRPTGGTVTGPTTPAGTPVRPGPTASPSPSPSTGPTVTPRPTPGPGTPTTSPTTPTTTPTAPPVPTGRPVRPTKPAPSPTVPPSTTPVPSDGPSVPVVDPTCEPVPTVPPGGSPTTEPPATPGGEALEPCLPPCATPSPAPVPSEGATPTPAPSCTPVEPVEPGGGPGDQSAPQPTVATTG
ncbi:hypothetical protein [Aquipuribacter hungaricus]|uniref:Transglycosylase SLT domain-containing protein n=1 Tax=Aquipuribacter hungaricus TaxID=545624 RepID=A0ABV7WIF6_9MICO